MAKRFPSTVNPRTLLVGGRKKGRANPNLLVIENPAEHPAGHYDKTPTPANARRSSTRTRSSKSKTSKSKTSKARTSHSSNSQPSTSMATKKTTRRANGSRSSSTRKSTPRKSTRRGRRSNGVTKQARSAVMDAAALAAGTVAARGVSGIADRTVLASQSPTVQTIVTALATGALGVGMISKGKRGGFVAGAGQGMVLNAVLDVGEMVAQKLTGSTPTVAPPSTEASIELGAPYRAPRQLLPGPDPLANRAKASMQDAMIFAT